MQTPLICTLALSVLLPFCSPAQQPDATDEETPKHVLWIVPNFRTAPVPEPFEKLTPQEKFRIARQDIFDRGSFALAAIMAADGQLTASNRSFGQGVAGSSHYLATAYADIVIGNAMTEGVFPALLHEDPRDFHCGSGGKWARLRFAVGQIFITRTDSGARQFNYSEFAGNSAAVAISMAYYPDNRRASDAVSKLGVQIGLDLVTNIAKEFWPDRRRKRE